MKTKKENNIKKKRGNMEVKIQKEKKNLKENGKGSK